MIGIVAEYNPYHIGHSFLIAAAELELGRHEPVVAVMSGDYVQRGECAVRDKFWRAEKAVRGSVDLVIELPLPWCLSSAEGFARGGVGLLREIGCDTLVFGSESGNVEELKVQVDNNAVKDFLSSHPETSYAKAVREVTHNSVFDGPNNILGIEYMKYSGDMDVITVKRTCDHDGPGSAKYIRENMKRPDLDSLIVSRLKMFDKEYFSRLPDSSDGAGNRLYESVHKFNTLSDIQEDAKTKRYTMSRIRRLTMCAALGVMNGDNDGIPPYARVLAFNDTGREALSEIKKKSTVKVVTLPKEIKKFDERSKSVFACGASARELLSLGINEVQPEFESNDYKIGPVIV